MPIRVAGEYRDNRKLNACSSFRVLGKRTPSDNRFVRVYRLNARIKRWPSRHNCFRLRPTPCLWAVARVCHFRFQKAEIANGVGVGTGGTPAPCGRRHWGLWAGPSERDLAMPGADCLLPLATSRLIAVAASYARSISPSGSKPRTAGPGALACPRPRNPWAAVYAARLDLQ